MSWENEIMAVCSGQKVLIPAVDILDARKMFLAMAEAAWRWPELEPRQERMMITCKNGGFAHFAWKDCQVRGMEYDEAMGPITSLTPAMRARVRLVEPETPGEAAASFAEQLERLNEAFKETRAQIELAASLLAQVVAQGAAKEGAVEAPLGHGASTADRRRCGKCWSHDACGRYGCQAQSQEAPE